VTTTNRAPTEGSAGVVRSSAVMAAGTATSRVLGFVRAALLAAAIGTVASGDAFSVANTVPNTLYILLAGGVLNAVLVPQITRADAGEHGGQEYLDRLVTVSLAVLVGASVVVTAMAPLLVRLYAEDFDAAMLNLATGFAIWCLPQVFFYGLYTLFGQVLNARGNFGPYMWAPVANNVVAIIGLCVFIAVAGRGDRPVGDWTPGTIALLAGTATAGVAAQALVLLPALHHVKFRFRLRWGWRGVGLRTASRVAFWTFGAVLIAQLGFVITSKVATAGGVAARATGSGLAPGKSTYDYAFLLFMLPHSLITVSVVTALFTRMARAAVAIRIDRIRDDLSLGLRLTGVVTVLATATFLALGTDITASLFPGNSSGETRGIAYVAMAMMLGLVPFSSQYLFQRVFYVFEDARTPFLIQVPVMLIWSVGNLLSLWLMPPQLIVVGIGLAMSAANLIGAGLSLILLRHRLLRLDGGRVLSTYLKLSAAAAFAGALAWMAARGVHAVAGSDWPATVLATAVGGTVIVGCYVGGLMLLGVSELGEMLRPLLRRPRGVRGRGRPPDAPSAS
jgi:murein biosynthesis integral membrane protein MurJ